MGPNPALWNWFLVRKSNSKGGYVVPLSHVNFELGILPLECCLFTRKGPGFSRDVLFLQYLLSGCIKDSEFLVLLASVPSAA